MRRSRLLRSFIIHLQNRFVPDIYSDLFEKYQPMLVCFAYSRLEVGSVHYYVKRLSAVSAPPLRLSAGITLPLTPRTALRWTILPVGPRYRKRSWYWGRIGIPGGEYLWVPAYDGYFPSMPG